MTDRPRDPTHPDDGTLAGGTVDLPTPAPNAPVSPVRPADPSATLDAETSRAVPHPDDRTLPPPSSPSGSATLDLALSGHPHEASVELDRTSQILPPSSPAASDGTLNYMPSAEAAAGATQDLPTGAVPPAASGDGTAMFTGQSAAPPAGSASARSAGTSAGGPGGAAGPAADGPRYAPDRVVARGGMGEIWVTQDRAIGRTVALKRMLGTPRSDQQVRFLFEAKVTGQLEHPGVVPVHEVGRDEAGRPYYVMKFVQGRTLKAIIKDHFQDKRPFQAPREVEFLRLLEVFVQLCRTVGYAHSRGVLHRDLKPENVMIGAYGETMVLDWGLAKIVGVPDLPSSSGGPGGSDGSDSSPVNSGSVHAESTDTMDGAVMGSPFYLSPEAAAGQVSKMDQRSDVYLLGATLYEILTGRPPREGKNVMDLVRRARSEPPDPPRKVRPEVPRPLDAICQKALAMKPADRYPDALTLADDVQRYIAGEPVSAYREGLLEKAWRWARRHKKALARAAMAVAVVGVAMLVTNLLLKANQLRQEAERRARVLQAREDAQKQVAAFRRQADEARFLAANTSPAVLPRSQANDPGLLARTLAAGSNPREPRSPYFDPAEARAAAASALALAEPWGPDLAQLPLDEERPALAGEVYDLMLVGAQAAPPTEAGARDALALLERAAPLHETPTRGFHLLRARALARTGDQAAAQEAAARAAAPDTPLGPQDHFLEGESLRSATVGLVADTAARRDLLEKAVEQYRAALARDPAHFWSQYQLGRCYLGLGRDAEAVEALGACIALKPDSPWGYAARGFALAQLKRLPQAEADLNEALRRDSTLRPVRLNRGWVYLEQKKYQEALDDLDAVLAPPEVLRLAEAVYYKALVHLAMDNPARAREVLEPVTMDRPSLRPAALLRAQLRLENDDVPGALADLGVYVGVGPALPADGAEASERRGRELLRMAATLTPPARRRALEAAVLEFRRAESKGADSAELYRDYGRVLEMLGQLPRAVDAYTRGLDRDPDHVRLLCLRGWAQEQLKQYDAAREDFARAVRKLPTDAEAHTGAGYLSALAKDYGAARREANLALLHGAGDYLVLHNVACIYGVMAGRDRVGAEDHENAALDLLRQAVTLWKEGGRGPDEVQLIRTEPAFPDTLKKRREFQELVGKS